MKFTMILMLIFFSTLFVTTSYGQDDFIIEKDKQLPEWYEKELEELATVMVRFPHMTDFQLESFKRNVSSHETIEYIKSILKNTKYANAFFRIEQEFLKEKISLEIYLKNAVRLLSKASNDPEWLLVWEKNWLEQTTPWSEQAFFEEPKKSASVCFRYFFLFFDTSVNSSAFARGVNSFAFARCGNEPKSRLVQLNKKTKRWVPNNLKNK